MDLALQRRDLYRFHGGIQKVLYEGTITEDGNTKTSNPVYVMPFKEGTFFINCTAKSGTNPTLDLLVITKQPGQDQWNTLATFTQLTDVGSEMKAVAANLGDTIALIWTKGGTTPSFTVKVTAILKVF